MLPTLPNSAPEAAPNPDPKKPKRGNAINPQPLHAVQLADALLKIQTVSAVTALSAASVYRKLAAKQFQEPVRLGTRCTRWRAADIRAWMAAQTVGV